MCEMWKVMWDCANCKFDKPSVKEGVYIARLYITHPCMIVA